MANDHTPNPTESTLDVNVIARPATVGAKAVPEAQGRITSR